MARIVGIFQFNGKLGEAVGMKGEDGLNYTRVRVREVNNPNTKGQQQARTAISLAGKISSLTPRELITGLKGSSNRKRRSEFTRNIILNADVQESGGEIVAKLSPAKLVLSQGREVDLPSMTISMNNNTVNITPSATWPNNNLDAVIMVVYGVDLLNNYVDCRYATILKGEATQTSITLNTGVADAIVYAIPVVRNEGASEISYQSALQALTTNRDFAVKSSGTASSALSYEQSKLVAKIEPDE